MSAMLLYSKSERVLYTLGWQPLLTEVSLTAAAEEFLHVTIKVVA